MAMTAYAPPLPGDVRANPIRSLADWQRMRDACLADPGAFHGGIAAHALHWYHPDLDAWLSRGVDGQWRGWRCADGSETTLAQWTPWRQALDESDAPFYLWFCGGLTNAAFNEVDRHVLAGHGAEVAYYYEGDRWDDAANGGRGGPVHQRILTRRELLIETVLSSLALKRLGLEKGDRIALNMPNILEQIVWTEAAKRLGVIYTAVFGGFSDKTLSDRIENAGARVVITADGASRNAETIPFKEVYSDPALDRYIALPVALRIVEGTARDKAGEHLAGRLHAEVERALRGEITLLPADVMRAVGEALARQPGLEPAAAAELRADIAHALAQAPSRVEKVIVVRHTGQPDLPWTEGRDVWAHDLLAAAERELAERAGLSMDALRALPDADLWLRLWRVCPCAAVDAEFPLYIIYTSGSTGKPKGVVHVHGGYVAGVAHTLKVSFDALPGRDVIYVVADPGWITGQSYLISASLAARIPGVVTEGSPLFPHAGRFASVIERYGVTIFKAGVTFLKAVMANPQDRADVERYDLSTLRVATFCAEPTSPSVQRFGMELMTPQYINSYWATEHGGIVWTHPYGNPDLRLRADAHCYPLPWVMGDIWVAEGEADADGRVAYRRAGEDEKGEVVITAPYPYLARTVWGDAEHVGEPQWRGDLARFAKIYYGRFRDAAGKPVLAYVQGDFAVRYPDGSFSFHGRSDDVINVSGHRMGTEEIEGAILKDKALNPDSPVGNCIVVGAPHREKGLTPVAFVLEARGKSMRGDDERRLKELVREEKGAVAVPGDFITLPAFPETRSGKYMRRFLKALILGEELGDTTTLRNPECLDEIRRRIEQWRHGQARREEQRLFQDLRFIRVQYDAVGRDADGNVLRIATLTVRHPPVNALSERVLDELSTLLSHIERRDDVRAAVIAGADGKTFVAGADVRQLLEEVRDLNQARALPAKAHAVFARIERMQKPVVAAVEGLALGGGCELALACHYRVGNARTRLGQPEINLFLPPGYGGTQRLPRLLAAADPAQGLSRALLMLLSGRQTDARQAHRFGLLDRVVAGSEDVLSVCKRLAREAALTGRGPAIEAMRTRHAALAEWERPGRFDEVRLREDADLARCLHQAHQAGRGAVAESIVGLMKTGFEQGFQAGLAQEIDTFARFVMDGQHGGKKGIALFLDKRSPPLPSRPRIEFTPAERARLIAEGRLLPVGSPFFPGITPLPEWQVAHAVVHDPESDAAGHGEPKQAEKEIFLPVPMPGPNQALLYVLASEINFNDVWAITGIPISVFDEHDEDAHVTGSGGLGLIVALGEAAQAEGRLQVGDVVAIYSGVSDLLDPEAGRDPMFTRFVNQGYQTPDGSHQQFMAVDGPQCVQPPAGLTLEQAGSYVLAGGTVYRCLFNSLKAQPGKRLFVEGAASGTGSWAVLLGLANRNRVTGMVSSDERRQAVEKLGARAVDRRDPAFSGCFSRVPADPAQWAAWERAGEPFLAAVRTVNDGELMDFAVSHAGERAFPRSFQALAPGGVISFYGASSGYTMTFLGKPGSATAAAMLDRAGMLPGETVAIYYGLDNSAERDRTALEMIETVRGHGGRIAVITRTDAQRDFVLSLGFGDAVAGAVSLAELKRRAPHFQWPNGMPELPDPLKDIAAFKEAVRLFNENVFKPLAGAVGRILRSADNPRGMPDIVMERAGRDSLAVSVMLVKPYSGRVAYLEEMGGRRYSFYAQQVWMRQRRILMPTAAIHGTHLCNAAEVQALNRTIAAGIVDLPPLHLFPWHEAAAAHQAMWENRLPERTGGANKALLNHALPETGLKSRDELFASWALAQD